MRVTGRGRNWRSVSRKVGDKVLGWTVVRVSEETGLILFESKSQRLYRVDSISPRATLEKYTTPEEGNAYIDEKLQTLQIKA